MVNPNLKTKVRVSFFNLGSLTCCFFNGSVAKLVVRNRLKILSALSEMKEVEYRKFREPLPDNADGNPEPSLIIKNKKGAETLHGIPKSMFRYGKEKVQTTKLICSENCSGKKICRSLMAVSVRLRSEPL